MKKRRNKAKNESVSLMPHLDIEMQRIAIIITSSHHHTSIVRYANQHADSETALLNDRYGLSTHLRSARSDCCGSSFFAKSLLMSVIIFLITTTIQLGHACASPSELLPVAGSQADDASLYSRAASSMLVATSTGGGGTTDHPCHMFNALCTCSKPYPDLGRVVCQDVPLSSVGKLNESTVYSARLNRNGLHILEERSFHSTGIYSLEISDNLLVDLPPGAFYGVEQYLRQLILSRNLLSRIPREALRPLRRLQSLDLSDNQITDITFEDFFPQTVDSNMAARLTQQAGSNAQRQTSLSGSSAGSLSSTLKWLSLAHNSISFINQDVFAGLKMLEHLDLHGNNIHFFHERAFASQSAASVATSKPSLRRINLSDNKLDKIPLEMISSLQPSLKSVALARNLISSTLDSYTSLGRHIALDSLDLSENAIKELPSGALANFASIKSLNLAGNPIGWVADDALKGAKIVALNLRGCSRLSNLSIALWNQMESSTLEVLDLSYNALDPTEISIPPPQPLPVQSSTFSFLPKFYSSSPVQPPPPATNQYSQSRGQPARNLGKQMPPGYRGGPSSLPPPIMPPLPASSVPRPAALQQTQFHLFANDSFQRQSKLRGFRLDGNARDFRLPVGIFAHQAKSLNELSLRNQPQGAGGSSVGTLMDPFKFSPDDRQSFQALRHLSLTRLKSGVGRLSGSDFNGFGSSIERLDLSQSNVHAVDPDAFSNLPMLRSLNLSYTPCRLSNIHPQALRPVGRTLAELDISHLAQGDGSSSAFTLQCELLQGLSALNSLSLASNRLIGFSNGEQCLSPLISLRTLVLSLNDLTSLAGEMINQLSSLTYLFASFNLIGDLGSGFVSIPNLRYVDLSHNLLKKLNQGSFDSLKSLETVNLEWNLIETIEPEAFRNTPKISLLLLGNNKINHLNLRSFDQVGTLSTFQLNMDHNSILTLSLTAPGAAESPFYGGDDNAMRSDEPATSGVSYTQDFSTLGSVAVGVGELPASNHSSSVYSGSNSPSTIHMADEQASERRTAINQPPHNPHSHQHTHHHMQHVSPRMAANTQIMSDDIDDMFLQSYYTDSIPFMFSNIQKLSLRHSGLTSISDSFFGGQLRNSLIYLDLSHNSLKQIDEGQALGSLKHLQWLDLSHNQIELIHSNGFEGDIGLQVLDMSYNGIVDLPPGLLGDCARLKVLNLGHNAIRVLSDDFLAHNLQLERLDLSDNRLALFPANALRPVAQSLRELDVSDNSIRYLRSEDLSAPLNELTRLIVLNLGGNQISTLPDSIFAGLASLRSLDLSRNPMSELKEQALSGLEESLLDLRLTHTNMSHMPTLNLPHLQSLNISHNAFSYIYSISLANTSALRQLDISHNRIQFSPNNVWHILTHIRKLDISSNPIITLSNDSFIGLDRLEELRAVNLTRCQYIQYGSLRPMTSLRSISVSTFPDIKHFSLGKFLLDSVGLEDLELHVRESSLSRETIGDMRTPLPKRLKRLTLGGKSLERIDDTSLSIWSSHTMQLQLKDTNVTSLQASFFSHLGGTRRLSLDLADGNPVAALGDLYLTPANYSNKRNLELEWIKMSGSDWRCNCEMALWAKDWLDQIERGIIATISGFGTSGIKSSLFSFQSYESNDVRLDKMSTGPSGGPAALESSLGSINTLLVNSNNLQDEYSRRPWTKWFHLLRDFQSARCANLDRKPLSQVLRKELRHCYRTSASSSLTIHSISILFGSIIYLIVSYKYTTCTFFD